MDSDLSDLFQPGPKSLLEQYKIPLLLLVAGVFLVLVGVRLLSYNSDPQVEFIEATASTISLTKDLKVDVAGAVERPGLYLLPLESRIQDALVLAGGLSAQADRTWVAKHVNLAAKLNDGMKVYIPAQGEKLSGGGDNVGGVVSGITSNTSEGIININSASEAELDTLPGVGQITAQKIMTNRPYQTVEELLTKKVVNKSTFEKIKLQVSVN